jgi:DNA-binding MarR family transcriptional regulator
MDRLTNLLASVSLGVQDDAAQALEEASGLSGSGAAALLALEEFLGGTPIGRLADALGLTHSGAVRLVALLERKGLAQRAPGATDRRQVEVHLTAAGRARAATARSAREAVLVESLDGLDAGAAAALEVLLEQVVAARVAARMARRRAGEPGGAWWCRTCDFAACGRPEGRCPAQVTAAATH